MTDGTLDVTIQASDVDDLILKIIFFRFDGTNDYRIS